jgi:hypothetical protein
MKESSAISSFGTPPSDVRVRVIGAMTMRFFSVTMLPSNRGRTGLPWNFRRLLTALEPGRKGELQALLRRAGAHSSQRGRDSDLPSQDNTQQRLPMPVYRGAGCRPSRPAYRDDPAFLTYTVAIVAWARLVRPGVIRRLAAILGLDRGTRFWMSLLAQSGHSGRRFLAGASIDRARQA